MDAHPEPAKYPVDFFPLLYRFLQGSKNCNHPFCRLISWLTNILPPGSELATGC
jgi:hypothetical protein